MASLIEKLGSTISGKVSGSLSDFGAGAKSAFISANPAVFAPVANALSKGFARLGESQARIAKGQVNAEKEKRGVQEEKEREDKKVFADIQSTLNIISDDVKKILDVLTKNAKKDSLDGLKGALAAGAGAGLASKGLAKLLDDIVKAIKKLPGLLADIFKFLKNLPDFFKTFKGKFATGLDDLLKFLKKTFPKTFSALGDLGKTLRNLLKSFKLDDIAKAIGASLNNLKKFFKFDDILDFFKSVPAKFKSIFKLDDLGKQFRSLRNTVLITIGYIADKFDDILSSVKNNKAFSAISGLVGDFVKVVGALIGESVNIVRGAIAGIAGKAALSAKPTKSLPTSIANLGKTSAAMMEGKAAVGAVSTLPDAIKAADAVGDVGQAAKNVGILGKLLSSFSGLGNLAAGPLKFLAEITDVMGFVKGIGKILGPIGVIFSIFDGISTATDTQKLQSIFGKFDITLTDRISGFIGGFIGGFGALFDLLANLMGIEIEGESIQSSLTRTVTLMTDSIFEGIKNFLQFIGKILTSEPAKAVFDTAKELIGTVADGIGKMFQFFKDIFFSESFQRVITVLTQIAGQAIGGVIKAITNVVEIIVGLFQLDFSKVKDSVGDLFGLVVKGITNALSMVANGIIWAINGLMDTLRLPSTWRISYFDTGIAGGNMFAGGNQTAATANRTGVGLNSQGRTASDPRYAQNAAPTTIIEQQLPGYFEKVIQAESGGRNIANQSGPGGTPTSSAFGIAQFTKGTFEDTVRRAPPGSPLKGKTFEDMKVDTNLQKIALAELTQHNANFLSSKGIPVNDSTLYLAHFLGPAGAANLYAADDNKMLEGVISDTQYNANPSIQKMTVGDLKRWAERKMGMPASVASASAASPQEQREQKQTVEAVQSTAKDTVEIRKSNEDQAETLSGLASDFENSTDIQKAQLDNLDAYHRENRAEAQRQTDLLKQTTAALSPEQQQRKNLEIQFLNQVESNIRGALDKALGPAGMGVTGQNANLNAYATYGSLLEKPFSNALTKVFGESGGAYGQIFSQVAGNYIRQAAEVILPSMGIDSNLFNRALANYTQGKQVRDQYKLAQTEFNITKAEYDAAAAKVTLADRLNATRPGKISDIKREQIAKVDALELALQQKGASLDQAGQAKKANRSMYTEDLIMAITGMPTGIRSMMGYETGQDQLTKQLTMMIGGPVAQGTFGGAGLQDYMNQYRQMYGQQLQGQENVAVQSAALQGQVGLNNAEMQMAVSNQHVQGMSQVLGGHIQGMGQMIGAMPSGQQSGGGFLETLGNLWTTGEQIVGTVGRFFGFGESSTSSYSESGGIDEHVFNPNSLGETSILGTLTNFGNTLTTGIKNIFTPSTSVGGGGSIPGVRPATVSGRLTGTDIAGNFLGNAISSKLGISGPSAGIVSSAMRDLLGGKGFGNTSKFIQGPGTFGSSLFNIFGLKSGNTSSLGGTLNTALNAYQLYSGLASGSLASSIASGVSFLGTASGATYGTALGSQQSMMLAAQEAGMGAAPGSFGAQAGSLGASAAGIIGGHYLGRAIAGGYRVGGMGNSTTNVGTAIGFALGGPVGALIGGALGGTVNRLFGRKPKAVTGTGLQVTMGSEQGASGQAYSDWVQKGGRYRSDKSGRDYSAIDPELLKYFGETSMELQKSYGGIGKTMGLDPNALKDFQRYYDISLTGMNQAQSVTKIQDTMKQYTRDMILSQYGDVTRFSKDLGDGKREDVLDTFQRLGKSSELVDYWMRGFGKTQEQSAKFLESAISVSSITGESLLKIPEASSGGILARWKKKSAESIGTVATAAGNISKDIIDAIGQEATNPNYIKLQLAGLKDALIESFGGSDAFSKEMGEAFSALYTQQEQATFARDTAISNTQGLLEAVSVSPEIKAYLDKFAAGGITKAEDVEAARLAYRAAMDQALGSGDLAAWQQLVVAGDQFMNAANLSLQAATMNKDVAEKQKTADEFFGFTEVQDFSQGVANGIAEAAPQMTEGPTSMFNLGSENLSGIVDRSYATPYYGDGTPISGLVSNAGMGAGGQGTIVLQPSVIDNSVLSNPSTNVYMDNSAVRDYHPILSIDVRNVTSGYLGLGSK